MEVMRIACFEPPESDRSRWSRELLAEALANELPPAVVPGHTTTTFTVTLQPTMALAIKKLAAEKNWSVPDTAAGLIQAVRAARAKQTVGDIETADSDASTDTALAWVRPELHSMVDGINKAIDAKKIAFAEAATGVGKGRMIALQVSQAARYGQRVVITAPLPVIWQLAETLGEAPESESIGVTLLLGRANFVSSELLRTWAEENENAPLLEWIADGAPVRSPRGRKLQERFGLNLSWLLDDALELADDLPASAVMLDADDHAEEVYQSLQGAGKNADIILCSHHLLAAHIRHRQLTGKALSSIQDDPEQEKPAAIAGAFPDRIDLLLVDEAHKLEEAFASIFSQSFYLHPFQRLFEHSGITGRKAALANIEALSEAVLACTQEAPNSYAPRTGILTDFPLVALRAQQLQDALSTVKVARKNRAANVSINNARWVLTKMLSGYGTIRLDVSPVRSYPQILVGSASLQNAFELLWGKVRAGVLVSATLYTDGVNAALTRWKLGVPKERAVFLQPVIPSWVTDPVLLHLVRQDAPAPDDSPEWIEFVAENIRSVCASAQGGTLVLCTSYHNANSLAAALLPDLGEQLICQTASMGASACAAKFRTAYANQGKPVWIGVGAAWTGIDLSDATSPAAEDKMLSDLVITRLPLGINRTLTHERRSKMVGFSIVVQEAVWHMRQGIGRLVRRPGVPERNLWILDPRLTGKESWPAGFRQALKRYRVAGKG